MSGEMEDGSTDCGEVTLGGGYFPTRYACLSRRTREVWREPVNCQQITVLHQLHSPAAD